LGRREERGKRQVCCRVVERGTTHPNCSSGQGSCLTTTISTQRKIEKVRRARDLGQKEGEANEARVTTFCGCNERGPSSRVGRGVGVDQKVYVKLERCKVVLIVEKAV